MAGAAINRQRRHCLALPLLLAASGAWADVPALRHGAAPPPGLGGPIDLIDQRGARFTLDRLSGRPALLFFGFTRCGSTCPVALATARQLLAASPMKRSPAVVFVTLDPLADSPAALGEYLGRIDARLIGLTGDPLRVQQAAERYGVGQSPRADGMDHSSRWYLLDGQGRVRRTYAHTTAASALMDDLQSLASL